jgi:arginyl-tRNA synthetase
MSQKFIEHLNSEEKIILKKIYTSSWVLQKITKNYKPHLLCTHLYEFSSLVNTWYSKYSVNLEADLNRKEAMLILCKKIKEHLSQNLELLGIQKIEKL